MTIDFHNPAQVVLLLIVILLWSILYARMGYNWIRKDEPDIWVSILAFVVLCILAGGLLYHLGKCVYLLL